MFCEILLTFCACITILYVTHTGQQNFNLDDRQIHQDANETLPSCEVRAGFADFLFSSVVGTAQQDLFACVENHCESPADCVIITGHSQGGAASLVLCTYKLRTAAFETNIYSFFSLTPLQPQQF